ncbi:hypothetical protein QQF64_005350 [Cirrhinus molitorella]|uniref:Secreted protein n=1 Tax=Cirrhinus molitorella TaxID=172907 RepID=A0ABR3MC20_9TELE
MLLTHAVYFSYFLSSCSCGRPFTATVTRAFSLTRTAREIIHSSCQEFTGRSPYHSNVNPPCRFKNPSRVSPDGPTQRIPHQSLYVCVFFSNEDGPQEPRWFYFFTGSP